MHVVITGASAGIGEALARAFGADPANRLTLVARRRERLEAIAEAVPARAVAVPADLADPARATDCLDAARSAHGPVDVLVNNAGVQVVGPSDAVDIEAADRSVALNLLTPLRLAHAVLPDLRGRSGSLVNIASMAALAPTPGMTWYNAGKAGLAAASEALRGELRGSGVHVLTVYPGIIQTDMADATLALYHRTPLVALQPVRTADQLAAAVVRATHRRRARLVYPRIYGPTRWAQPLVRWSMDLLTPPLVPAGEPS